MLNTNQLVGFGVGGAPSHLHWRIIWTEAATPGYAGADRAECGELLMYSVSGGSNLCTGGTPLVSSTLDPTNYPASEAFNGVTGTYGDYWASNNPATGEYIGYTFATPVEVREFVFWPSINFYKSRPNGFALEHSDDGATWMRAKAWTGLSWSNSPQTFSI